MAAIAQQSGGRFHFIEKSDQVAAVFHDEVLRLSRVAARNMTLQLTAGPGLAIARVLGQPGAAAGGRTTTIGLGDLSGGEQRDGIVRLSGAGGPPGGGPGGG